MYKFLCKTSFVNCEKDLFLAIWIFANSAILRAKRIFRSLLRIWSKNKLIFSRKFQICDKNICIKQEKNEKNIVFLITGTFVKQVVEDCITFMFT